MRKPDLQAPCVYPKHSPLTKDFLELHLPTSPLSLRLTPSPNILTSPSSLPPSPSPSSLIFLCDQRDQVGIARVGETL